MMLMIIMVDLYDGGTGQLRSTEWEVRDVSRKAHATVEGSCNPFATHGARRLSCATGNNDSPWARRTKIVAGDKKQRFGYA